MPDNTLNISPDDKKQLNDEQLKYLIRARNVMDADPNFKGDSKTLIAELAREMRAKNSSMLNKYLGPAAKAYKDKFAPTVTRGVARILSTTGQAMNPLGNPTAPNAIMDPKQVKPGTVPQWLAQQAVPQDVTALGIDAAMAATQIGPGVKALGALPRLFKWLGEYGAPILAGKEIAPMEGRSSTSGMLQAGTQVGAGKIIGGLGNFLGKKSAEADADAVTRSFGDAIKQILPHFKGKLDTVRDMAYAFTRGGQNNAINQVAKPLRSMEYKMGQDLGAMGAKITSPSLHDALVAGGADPTSTPYEFTFDQALKHYRQIRNSVYESKGGLKEGANYGTNRAQRSLLHSARDEMINEVDTFLPGQGSTWGELMRENGTAYTLNNLFHDLNAAGMTSGKMPVRELQLFLNNSRDLGYAQDFDSVLGDPKITDNLISSTLRGAPPHSGTDAPGFRESLRISVDPSRPTGLHMIANPAGLFSPRRIGNPARNFPKIPGAIPGALTQNAAKFLGQAETQPPEGEPVDTGGVTP